MSISNIFDEIFSGVMIVRKIGVDWFLEFEFGEFREDNGERLVMEWLRYVVFFVVIIRIVM